MGIIIVRPWSLNKNQYGWSVTGAGFLDAALRDDTDSSYITSPTSANPVIGTEVWLRFGNLVGLPAQAQIKSVQLRVRFNGLNVTGQAASIALARLDPFKRWNLTPSNVNPVPTGITTYTYAKIQDSLVQSASAISNLVVILTSNHANNKFYEAYLDVEYNDRPTAVVTAPTGTVTTTSQPTVTWTPFDPDGDLIERAQVRVYTDGVYLTSNFTPDDTTTYPPIWDSGVLFTGNTSVTIGTPLPDADTYRAYVRLCDQGSGGAFGTWSYTTFQVATSPLASPTVSVSTDSVNARNVVTLQARNNILTANQSTLEDGNTTGWVGITNCTVAASTTQAKSGSWSLRMTSAAAGTMVAGTSTGTSGRPVVAGQAYTAYATLRPGSTVRSVQVGLRWFDSGGAQVGSDTYATAFPEVSGAWNAYWQFGTAPTGAAYASVLIQTLSVASGEIHYADEIALSPGTNTVWSRGLGGNSGSSNLFPTTDDASFEGGTIGSWGQGTENLCTLSNDATTGSDGTHSLKAVLGNPSLGQPYFWWQGTWLVTPGQQYTFLYTAKAGTSGKSVTVSIAWYDAAVHQIGPRSEATSSITTGYAQYVLTATAPAGAVSAQPQIIINGGATSDVMNFDKFSFAPGSSTAWVAPGASATASTVLGLIEYSDDNATWSQLRAYTAVDLTASNQQATCYDYEAPPGSLRYYRASVYAIQPVSQSSQPSSSASTTLPVGSWWLKNPNAPGQNMTLPVKWDDLSFNDEEAGQVFDVIGRMNSVIHSDGLKGDTFSLTLILNSAQYLAFRALRTAATVLLLQSDLTGQQWYVSMVGKGERKWKSVAARQASPTWFITAAFTQQDRPPN